MQAWHEYKLTQILHCPFVAGGLDDQPYLKSELALQFRQMETDLLEEARPKK